MTNENEHLARRAVACKGWRWMPGMLDAVSGRRVSWVRTDGGGTAGGIRDDDRVRPDNGLVDWTRGLPDFSDPATLGCLLALVREAWASPLIYVEPRRGGFEVRNLLGRAAAGYPIEAFVTVSRPTEAAALVAALEAAPR